MREIELFVLNFTIVLDIVLEDSAVHVLSSESKHVAVIGDYPFDETLFLEFSTLGFGFGRSENVGQPEKVQELPELDVCFLTSEGEL